MGESEGLAWLRQENDLPGTEKLRFLGAEKILELGLRSELESLTETGRLAEDLAGFAEANLKELETALRAAMGDDFDL